MTLGHFQCSWGSVETNLTVVEVSSALKWDKSVRSSKKQGSLECRNALDSHLFRKTSFIFIFKAKNLLVHSFPVLFYQYYMGIHAWRRIYVCIDLLSQQLFCSTWVVQSRKNQAEKKTHVIAGHNSVNLSASPQTFPSAKLYLEKAYSIYRALNKRVNSLSFSIAAFQWRKTLVEQQ